jgi:chromosome partitioning protein
MMYVALGHSAARTKPLEERFEKFIGACREEYDFVFIDCHPAGSIFTKTALQNSDHVLIPVAPQRYALRGIGLMLEFIAAKSLRGQPAMPHILFNLTPRDGVADEESQIRANPRYAGRCLNATLKEYKAFSEPADGSGFVWLSRKPWSTQAFRNLLTVASEFAGRIGMDFTL